MSKQRSNHPARLNNLLRFGWKPSSAGTTNMTTCTTKYRQEQTTRPSQVFDEEGSGESAPKEWHTFLTAVAKKNQSPAHQRRPLLTAHTQQADWLTPPSELSVKREAASSTAKGRKAQGSAFVSLHSQCFLQLPLFLVDYAACTQQ